MHAFDYEVFVKIGSIWGDDFAKYVMNILIEIISWLHDGIKIKLQQLQ